jgi:hypothetical protein
MKLDVEGVVMKFEVGMVVESGPDICKLFLLKCYVTADHSQSQSNASMKCPVKPGPKFPLNETFPVKSLRCSLNHLG